MSHDEPVEERRLQFLARAEEASMKAQDAEDPAIREWWLSAAEAWRYLAERSGLSSGS